MRNGLIWFVVLVVFGLLLSGCDETVKDAPHYRLKAGSAGEGMAVPTTTEVDLVEKMAMHRAQYRQYLEKVRDYYSSVGYSTRAAWAERELKQLDQVVQYKYLMPAEVAGSGLRARDSVAAADELFDAGMKYYRDGSGLFGFSDSAKLRQSLNKFNELIRDYPTSDKIDDASYRAAEIYEYFGDYEVAAVYYQRTFQWDPLTPYPARFKAARVLDKNLLMKPEALELYKLAVEEESRYKENTEKAQKRIQDLTNSENMVE